MGRKKRDIRPPFVVTLALSGLAACGGATDDGSGGIGGAGGGSSGSSGTSGDAGTGGRGWGGEVEPGSGGTAGAAANGMGGAAAIGGENTSGSAGSGANPPAPDVPPDPKFQPDLGDTFDPNLAGSWDDPNLAGSWDDPNLAADSFNDTTDPSPNAVSPALDPATQTGNVACDSPTSIAPGNAARHQACDCAPGDPRYRECEPE